MSDSTWDERIERVASHIEDNLESVDTAEDVAAVVDVSYETLRKGFRREKKRPLGEYIRQKRIDKARRLLVETDDPVYVVCRKVGYSNDSSGIRAFKRQTGLTMEEYRKKYRDAGA
jgi:transcriptional regulator GlxA family with amidase domain